MHRVKRLFDIFSALFGIIAASPLLLVLWVLVRLNMGSPVFFRQERPGLHGRPFLMCKYRTMTDRVDEEGKLLPDSQRLTLLGRFLRGSSLDELPELFNVLKGDMSLVGPRPLLMAYLDRYTPEQARRHEVRPGITGLAQVSGRQEIPFSKRFELDVWYIDHWSFTLDIKILLLTVWRVVGSRGVKSGQDVREVDDLGLSEGIVPLEEKEGGSSDEH